MYVLQIGVPPSGFTYHELTFLRSIDAIDLSCPDPANPETLSFRMATEVVLGRHCFSKRPASAVQDLGGEDRVGSLIEKYFVLRHQHYCTPERVLSVLNPFTRHWSRISDEKRQFDFSGYYSLS